MQLVDLLAAASLVTSLVALAIAVYAAFRSNINTSAGTFITFVGGFGEGWRRFDKASDWKDKEFEFAELLNLIEVGCAIYLDRSIHGASRKLLEHHLVQVLDLFEKNQWCRTKITELRTQRSTFEYMKEFLIDMRRKDKPQKIEAVVTGTINQPALTL